jgi:sugar lactone lactonase YvrE
MVVSYDPASDTEQIWEVGERVGTVVPRASGGLVIAGDLGFSFLDAETGEKTPIADPEADKRPDNRFNDGKCDPSGRFWAGTISTVKKTGDAALYRLDPGLRVTRMFTGVTNSNGICWSADARTMFYIDTPRKQVLAFDFVNATGAISNERVAIDTAALGLPGSPDGMTIDENGHLWIALCHAGLVVCLDPATNKELARVGVPEAMETTACAFGGPDLRSLYITTGMEKDCGEALGGRLFVAKPGARGVSAFAFGG